MTIKESDFEGCYTRTIFHDTNKDGKLVYIVLCNEISDKGYGNWQTKTTYSVFFDDEVQIETKCISVAVTTVNNLMGVTP